MVFPPSINGDGRVFCNYLRNRLDGTDTRIKDTEDLIPELKPDAPASPTNLEVQFDKNGVMWYWDYSGDSSLDFFELRTDDNPGNEINLVDRTRDLLSNEIPSLRSGTMYVYARGVNGQYSIPCTLQYNKAVPPMPTNVVISELFQGINIKTDPVPDDCMYLTVRVNGEEFATPNNSFDYNGTSGEFWISVAYRDVFGNGVFTEAVLKEMYELVPPGLTHISGLTVFDDGIIVARMIGDNQVVGTKIVENAITTGKLAANAVTAAKVAANAITADKINAFAITADKIASGTITADKIGAGQITTDHMTAGSIIGDRISAGTLHADRITSGSITADKIAANAITSNKIAANAIISTLIAAGAIAAGHISANSISADKIAAGTITVDKINVNNMFSQALGANGYITIPGGLMMQWGVNYATTAIIDGQRGIPFNATFPNACFTVVISPCNVNSNPYLDFILQIVSYDRSGIIAYVNRMNSDNFYTDPISWIAFGY